MASAACREEFALVRTAVVADLEMSRAGAAAPAPAVPAGDAGGAGGAGRVADGGVVPLRLASSAPPPAGAARARRRWGGAGVPLAIAATLLLAVGVTRWGGEAVGPVMRGALDAVVLATPPDGAETAPTPAFAWHPVPRAARYEFELVDATGTLVHQALTADTLVTLPPALALRPGARYRWLVRARDDAGQELGTATRALRVRAG
jgi:hypothetical protein